MAETIGLLALQAIGFEALASFVIFGAGTAALTVGGVVGGTLLAGGAIGLQLLLTRSSGMVDPGAPALPGPEAGHQPLRQTIAPRMVGLGTVRLAGTYVLFEAKAGTSYDVIAFHHGKVEAITGYYLHDDVVEIIGGAVQVQGDGRYDLSKVAVNIRLGEDTETAYSELISAMPEIWTSDHRGDGLASLLLVCQPVAAIQDFPTIYPRGKPEPSVVARCTPIYDPRDETQDPDDPSTWLVSTNPVLQMIFFLTDEDRGMGFDWDTMIEPVIDELMAKADICDEFVLKADGSSERRYESNGAYPLDADPADIINTILDTCDGWISENGDGTLAMEVGAYIAPTFTLESRHIKGVSLQFGLADEEAVNELAIDFTYPAIDYKTAPGQPWRDEDDISKRGKTLSQRLALPWVYSHSQARRLAKRRMSQYNAALRGTITTSLYGIQALGRRWIRVRSNIPGFEDVVVEVRGITVDLLNAQCSIKFISVDPDTIDEWDEETEEGDPPTVPEKLVAPPPPVPTITSISRAPSDFLYVRIADLQRSDLNYQISWRHLSIGGAFTDEPVVGPAQTRGGTTVIYTSTIFPANVTLEVKIRSFISSGGTGSAYSNVFVANV